MKECYMQCGVWNQMKIWSSHLLDNLSNCLMNLKNSGDSTGFEPMTGIAKHLKYLNLIKKHPLGAFLLINLAFMCAITLRHYFNVGCLNMSTTNNWRGAWNKVLSESFCNVKFSLIFSSKYKVIWKESMAIDQKSLKAFFHAPFQY